MPATYTKITQEEMELQLSYISKGFHITAIPRINEIVYEAEFKNVQWMAIRVYSSIEKYSKTSRKKGADAIRVCLVYKDKIIGGSKRVNRTQNWMNNLRLRATELGHSVSELKCNCGEGYMVERKGKSGKFHGCSEYPKCKQTRQIQ